MIDIYQIFYYKLKKNYPHQLINTRKAIMALSEELLNILACPKCKGDIYINETNDGLICDNCKLLYEIRDDIPIMLIDEAKSIDS